MSALDCAARTQSVGSLRHQRMVVDKRIDPFVRPTAPIPHFSDRAVVTREVERSRGEGRARPRAANRQAMPC